MHVVHNGFLERFWRTLVAGIGVVGGLQVCGGGAQGEEGEEVVGDVVLGAGVVSFVYSSTGR